MGHTFPLRGDAEQQSFGQSGHTAPSAGEWGGALHGTGGVQLGSPCAPVTPTPARCALSFLETPLSLPVLQLRSARGMATPQPHSALWGQPAPQPGAAQRVPEGLWPFGTAPQLGGP